LSHGTCSYIHIYINAVTDSVMFYLQHDFCNTVFKIERKLYIASESALPPPPPHPLKNSGCAPGWGMYDEMCVSNLGKFVATLRVFSWFY
jgi:hypothetical protein